MRIGRASSLAAAKIVSSSACLRTFWAIRVVGRSPAVWIVGNSSASMPFTWVAKRPAAEVERVGALELEVDLLGRRAGC